ncbi:hypothetical protein GGD38_000535 [Chitinophagaceae bacterium OAS944]|nr:hypothetical protein [Chitinophagaceae bacterium OAS944]
MFSIIRYSYPLQLIYFFVELPLFPPSPAEALARRASLQFSSTLIAGRLQRTQPFSNPSLNFYSHF